MAKNLLMSKSCSKLPRRTVAPLPAGDCWACATKRNKGRWHGVPHVNFCSKRLHKAKVRILGYLCDWGHTQGILLNSAKKNK